MRGSRPKELEYTLEKERMRIFQDCVFYLPLNKEKTKIECDKSGRYIQAVQFDNGIKDLRVETII